MSYPAGSTSSGTSASSRPGSAAERIARCVSSPFNLIRTSVPRVLMSSAVAPRQTRVTSWPAIRHLVANNDPYDAPRIKILRADILEADILEADILEVMGQLPFRCALRGD